MSATEVSDALDLLVKIGMLEKKKLYQQAGKRLLSFHRHEKSDLPRLLQERLCRLVRIGEHSNPTPASGDRSP